MRIPIPIRVRALGWKGDKLPCCDFRTRWNYFSRLSSCMQANWLQCHESIRLPCMCITVYNINICAMISQLVQNDTMHVNFHHNPTCKISFAQSWSTLKPWKEQNHVSLLNINLFQADIPEPSTTRATRIRRKNQMHDTGQSLRKICFQWAHCRDLQDSKPWQITTTTIPFALENAFHVAF